MPTQDVPRHEWLAFLESFSRRHRAWLATVEQPDGRSAGEARPFSAVTPERDGRHVSAVEISFAGDSGTDPVRVEHPTIVRVHQTPEGADRALEIMDEEGGCTRLVFRSTARSELLDGLAPGEI